MVHLAVKDEETEAAATFPFRVTRVLTDCGNCFTADGFEAACHALGVQHRTTKAYTPQTNGMVQHSNGRIGWEVLVHAQRTRAPASRRRPRLQCPPPARPQWPLARRTPSASA